jgi:hypothetical protein
MVVLLSMCHYYDLLLLSFWIQAEHSPLHSTCILSTLPNALAVSGTLNWSNSSLQKSRAMPHFVQMKW